MNRIIMKVQPETFVYRKPKYNLSTYCLLPICGIPFALLKDSLVNTYIFLKNKEQPEYQVDYLLHIVLDASKAKEDDLRQIRKCSRILQELHIIDFIVFTCRISDYSQDFNLFYRGAYHKFSGKLKDKITQGVKEFNYNKETKQTQRSLSWRLINPTDKEKEELAEQLGCTPSLIYDVYPKPNPKEETFDLDYIYSVV